MELCRALVAANIPWNAVQNTVFKSFLQKYCNQTVPSESTLRKNCLDSVYNQTLTSIRDDIGESSIWLCVDETTDAMGRYIANLVVGKMDPDVPSLSHLLCSKSIDKVNHKEIAYFVNKGLQLLYPGGVDDSKVLLLCSDAASYMIAASPLLQTFYPNLIHVTCLAHALHRIAETVRNEFSKVNSLISNMKKVFSKAPSRIALFRQTLPGVPLPPEPVITRWGTWIEAVLYYAEHLEEIAPVFNEIPADSAACVAAVKELLGDSSVKRDIVYIRSNFSFLSSSITKLEAKGKSLFDQLSIVREAEHKIKSATGKFGEKVREKWINVLKRNPGFHILSTVCDAINGEDVLLPKEISLANVAKYKYAPVTSVSVERSFSAYKMVLSDKRQSLTTENLEKILVMYCNANYNKVYFD